MSLSLLLCSYQITSINLIRTNRFPFYYELKIIVVLWLLSPATEGSSILYRKFVHPILVKREKVYFQTRSVLHVGEIFLLKTFVSGYKNRKSTNTLTGPKRKATKLFWSWERKACSMPLALSCRRLSMAAED